MTERGRTAAERRADRYRIGPSTLHWDGTTLVADVDEVGVPWPRRMRGRVVVHAPRLLDHPVELDPAGRHRWRPLAPLVRVEVDFPGLATRWRGHGYLDANDGDEPLEHAFRGWQWTRLHLERRRAAVFYDVETIDGARRAFAFEFDDLAVRAVASREQQRLARTAWGLERCTRGECGAHVIRSLEDAPFYSRALVETRYDGQAARGVHEGLSLDRFRRRWVQWMLPFRMPRRARSA